MMRHAIFALALMSTLICSARELDVLRGAGREDGFAQVLEPRELVFPRDHGPHPEFREEWWYVTGNLDAAGGERFGFELTFFRVALAPNTVAAASGNDMASMWRSRQIYVAHFAITDVARNRFKSTQRFERAALGLAGAQAAPFHVWLDDWMLQTGASSAGWTLHAQDADYELNLDMQPAMAPVLNGEHGLSR
jgi:predicted secreted hydrolase